MKTAPPALPDRTNPDSFNGVVRLNHLGVIKVTGDDAAKFIHGQLTHDFSLLTLDSARLAAFCNAKGRMQASFVGLKRADGDILLVCSADLLQPTLKRLSMFVMRAKARLSDASSEFSVFGLAGDTTLSSTGVGTPWAKHDRGDVSIIDLYPGDSNPRQLWVAPADHAAPQGTALDPQLWAWGEVRSGVATVSAPVAEAFVPQMLNYESVGGVNFKKGCYPGQEVVARSQFRGSLKRRAFLVHALEPMHAGDLLYAASDPEQPVATVVQGAPAPQGGFDAIVSGQISAMLAGGLHVGRVDGPVVELQKLPYPLLEDV